MFIIAIDPTTLIFFYKISLILCGLVSIYLGYRLFGKGIMKQGGSVDGKIGRAKINFKRAAPGTFFTVLGAAIIIVSVVKGFNYHHVKEGDFVDANSIPEENKPPYIPEENDDPNIAKKIEEPQIDKKKDRKLITKEKELPMIAGDNEILQKKENAFDEKAKGSIQGSESQQESEGVKAQSKADLLVYNFYEKYKSLSILQYRDSSIKYEGLADFQIDSKQYDVAYKYLLEALVIQYKILRIEGDRNTLQKVESIKSKMRVIYPKTSKRIHYREELDVRGAG